MQSAMQAFAFLLSRLILTPQRNGKLRLIEDYARSTPDPERGWAIAAITRDLTFASAKPAMLRNLIGERMDPVLFAMSYDYVGDLAETISLAWPQRPNPDPAPSLTDVVAGLTQATRASAPKRIEGWLDALDADGRWALLKLVTGGLRVGVSARLTKQALANLGDKDITEIEELWHGLTPPYVELFSWLEGRAGKPTTASHAPFRPVMLATTLIDKAKRGEPDAIDPTVITPETYAAEWKWDGIRVQAASQAGVRRLYTRTGDDISHTFPDVLAAMEFEGAIDGELLVGDLQGGVAPFNALQQRLNRKTVTKKLLADSPAFIRAYDILHDGDDDWRARRFAERRERLEAFILAVGGERFDLSERLAFEDFDDLAAKRANPPASEIEGVMLKRWDSVYAPGRPKGPWLKWKRDPYLVDAVLMYAQRGHGKRSSFYSDFTFGVWRSNESGEPELTPVGKAYFGFTDSELKELDKFVRNNTTDRFGPVRAVVATQKEGLVLEVAFEGLNVSARHKSGIAMRFPRINRIRWDKPSAEADTLNDLHKLLP